MSRKPSDFIDSSVAYGLHHGEFDNLNDDTKRKLIRLMARISEASYRRGFQQGSTKTQTLHGCN